MLLRMAITMKPSDNARPVDDLSILEALPHLLLLTALFFTTFLARIILAPLLPTIETELAIGHRSAGNLFFILSSGYFLSLLSTIYLAGRFQHRTLIIASSIGLGSVLLTAPLITTIAGLRSIVFLLGLSAGLYLPSGISAVTHLTRASHWGRALAIHELAPNLAFILAPVVAELMLHYITWRLGLAILGSGALLLGLLYTVRGRGTRFHGQMPDRQAAQYLVRQPSLWLLIALFSLGISSTLGIYTMLPLYLVSNHGLDHGSANTLLAVSRFATLPMAFAGGWMADRFGPLPTIRVVFLLTGLATIALGLMKGPWLQSAVFCQPLLAVCFFPAGFSALSALNLPEYRNIAVSLTIPAAFLIGGGGVPLAIGWLGDAGLFTQAFILTGILIILGSGLTTLLPPGH
jgi:MFS transporter, NNP family, nitrate/nitrite transporter